MRTHLLQHFNKHPAGKKCFGERLYPHLAGVSHRMVMVPTYRFYTVQDQTRPDRCSFVVPSQIYISHSEEMATWAADTGWSDKCLWNWIFFPWEHRVELFHGPWWSPDPIPGWPKPFSFEGLVCSTSTESWSLKNACIVCCVLCCVV